MDAARNQKEAQGQLPAAHIVTVDGLMGTGCREVGTRLASALGVEYINETIIDLAAERLGVQADQVSARRQTLSRSFPLSWSVFAFGLPMASDSSSLSHMTDEELFQVQKVLINETASTTSCVIVGWQARRIIEPDSNVVSVFLHADRNARVERHRKRYRFRGLEEAREALDESDNQQTQYFRRMFRQDIQQVLDYQLSIDTTAMSAENVAQLILEFMHNCCAAVSRDSLIEKHIGTSRRVSNGDAASIHLSGNVGS